MNNKKLLKIMQTIDEKIEALTDEQFINYCYGDGLFTILEKAIDEVLWDKESVEKFWQTYQSNTYDGTPYEANIDYEILEKYFVSVLNNKSMQLRNTPRIKLIKECFDRNWEFELADDEEHGYHIHIIICNDEYFIASEAQAQQLLENIIYYY